MIRPRLVDIWTIAPCEECQFFYPSHLTASEVVEIDAWMALTLRKIRTGAERRAVPTGVTPADPAAELDAWRRWAQYVYLGGGPVTLDDASLRAAVCETHDTQDALRLTSTILA